MAETVKLTEDELKQLTQNAETYSLRLNHETEVLLPLSAYRHHIA